MTQATTFVFTDIEGSTRLWEEAPERMQPALAAHDALLRTAVAGHGGTVVKMTGDGMHAAFDDPVSAVRASVEIQLRLADESATCGLALRVRFGLHAGAVEQRDGDYVGGPVNRAARIMRVAHGGQVLLSGAVVDLVRDRLPDGCTLRDLGRVRLRDLSSPELVAQLLHPMLRAEFPALRSLEATPNNLPQQLSSFVGRERELSATARLLRERRLLTLVGIGGIGKTRLALQAAAESLERFPDGAWLVELAPISDPELVASAVAQALSVQDRPGAPLVPALCRHLKTRQLLLVLDNCEHVIESCAALAKSLLAAAPEVRILATSREPLNIKGEQTLPVPPLSLPEMGSAFGDIVRADAAQLFVERARLQQPHFALTERHAAVITELCRQLDGIPLALELAAARAHTLSLEDINARLDDRFKLLTGGSRTALPRQQTLRATLDWSYGMLDEDERTVLGRLAIFAGGFTLEGATFVAALDGADDYAMLDLLSQLVERSLVAVDAAAGGSRYRLLETTRAYALEKLGDAGKREGVERRHAQYFAERFARATDDWLRMSDAEWRATYLPELDNVRAALDWSLGTAGDAKLAIALAGASAAIWPERSLHGEGQRRLEAAVARADAETPVAALAPLWLALGLQWAMAAPTQAHSALERSVELYRRLGDAPRLGFALVRLGHELTVMGRFDEAAAVLDESRPLLEGGALPKALGDYFDVSGMRKALTSDSNGARSDFASALELYRRQGAERYAIFTLAQLADIAWALGELDDAASGLREAVALLRKSPLMKVMLGFCLANLSGVYTERGELHEALAAERESVPLLIESGNAWVNLDHVALRAALAGDTEIAARIAGFADAARHAREATRQPNEARARARLETLLNERLEPGELARLQREGAAMSEDEAFGLILGDRGVW